MAFVLSQAGTFMLPTLWSFLDARHGGAQQNLVVLLETLPIRPSAIIRTTACKIPFPKPPDTALKVWLFFSESGLAPRADLSSAGARR